MSTRGHVAIKENGKYRYIYNHNDSYIDGLGITLYKHYNNVDKVRALIELGNTSSIYNTVENTANSYTEHLDRPSEERGTVAKFRECERWEDYCHYEVSWEECKPIETENISEVLGAELGAEFTYIFDADVNKWYVAYNGDKYQLRYLEEVLHSKELLEKLFSDMYYKTYLPEFYEKCLKA